MVVKRKGKSFWVVLLQPNPDNSPLRLLYRGFDKAKARSVAEGSLQQVKGEVEVWRVGFRVLLSRDDLTSHLAKGAL